MLQLSFLILQLSTSFGVHISVKLCGAEGDQHCLHSVCVLLAPVLLTTQRGGRKGGPASSAAPGALPGWVVRT